MDGKRQSELLSLNREFAAVISEARNAGAIDSASSTGGALDRTAMLFDPAELYGAAMAKFKQPPPPDTDSVTAADFARSIRMTAAKIRAGDRAYIIESLVGQAGWLQALAQSVSDYGSRVKDPRQKVALGHLVIKIEGTAAKILATLAGVSCLEKP